MDLQGKVVIVTGAGRGLGKAMCDALADAGAKVYGADIKGAYFDCDVTNEQQVIALFESFSGLHGHIDAVINCAGITADAMTKKMTVEQFKRVVKVNLLGTWLVGREALRTLEPGGCIINISSCNREGQMGQSNYSATKAGVVGMMKAWAKEGARSKIRAVAIAPGYIETEMTAAMKQETLQFMADSVPLKRLGQPEEIASAVKFVLENDYVNGTVIEVDGGLVV